MHSPTLIARVLGAALVTLVAVSGCRQGAALTPVRAPHPLTVEEQALAKAAVRYLERERQPSGLVSSNAAFPATTMWDAASQLGGMVAARELGLLSAAAFDAWMAQALASLGRLPLYKNELPNKAYHANTLMPVNYGKLDRTDEIGFSALDLGRMALWLDIVAARYPQHRQAARAVTTRWRLDRVSRGGEMMGTHVENGREAWNQEGRLGYEQYAAYGLSKLGVTLDQALDPRANAIMVEVEGVPVPADRRDARDFVAHNYVTSEPYVLDGLETGFKALPLEFAASVLQAQERRFARTQVLTAWSEDSLDRAPWFAYNCLFVDGQPWRTLDANGQPADRVRGSSTKAALAWHALFRTPYTEKLHTAMRGLLDPDKGIYAGTYEALGETNKAISLNTCGIVLEGLLYAQLGRPLEEWAHGPHDRP